ncbi:MAG: FAD-binding protein [Actinomyces sp.]|nr:MAG: FAD-binding protein [Actinomyces sp.]
MAVTRLLPAWRRSRRTEPDRSDPFVAALVAALSPDRVRVDATERRLVAHDASIFGGGRAGPVVFPETVAEVQAVVRLAAEYDRALVPRGAGTGLAGGAIPLAGAVVVSTTRMNRLLSVDPVNRRAWVQPGMINLDLTRAVAAHGLHYAPDPSSQQACTIGGNVANNSGGPHCLAAGVTSQHVLAVEVVLPDGRVVVLGGEDPEPPGLDLRGVYVGSEGTLGITTAVLVRLTPDPPAVTTLLFGFDTVTDGAATVGAVIAAGIVPAALEMMDRRITRAVEEFAHAGYPTDVEAVLLVELDGPPGRVAAEAAAVERIARDHGAGYVRVAADDAERALLWKGRKNAFGAISRVKPDYYLHDTVVPRRRLVEVLEAVYRIAEAHDVIVMNVFHAGDGNLHPLLIYDAREPGAVERVHAAGAEIIEASLAAGGVLSGEHGIGVEKRDFMNLFFSDVDLEQQARVRSAFDPACRANPGKVLPAGHSCADIAALTAVPDGVWV